MIPIEWFSEAFWLVPLLWQESGGCQELDHLEEVKTGNKVSVGEPAEGSLLIIPNGYWNQCEQINKSLGVGTGMCH